MLKQHIGYRLMGFIMFAFLGAFGSFGVSKVSSLVKLY